MYPAENNRTLIPKRKGYNSTFDRKWTISLFLSIYFVNVYIVYMLIGRVGTLDYKLYWHPKFYNYVILFFGSKFGYFYWISFVGSKLLVSKFISTEGVTLFIIIEDAYQTIFTSNFLVMYCQPLWVCLNRECEVSLMLFCYKKIIQCKCKQWSN